MFRIGTVNIDTSHAPSFAEILQKGDVARYTCVYNDGFRTDEEVDAFITRFGLEKRYTSLEEMAGNVDIAFIQGCDWDRHLKLAEPFVKAGVPVFIDKPIVGNLRDCHTLEAWAASGAVILGTSALRYTYEHDDFFSVPAADRGDIVHVTTSVGVDEFNYAIHAVESIMGFMRGDKPVAVRYIARSHAGETPVDSYYVTFAGGASACYHICLKGWQPSTATVVTTKTTYVYKIDTNKVYEAMLKHVCRYLQGEDNLLVSVPEMTESVKLMLAGRRSKQLGGAEVLVASLTEADGGFDGAAFAKAYAAQQKAAK